MGFTVAVIGAAAAVGGAIVQADAAHDAKKANERAAQAQREQAQIENKRADITNARSLRNAVRQARIARATILNVGANAGTSASSGVLGGTASIDAQRNSNIGFFGEVDQLNDQSTASKQEQANATVDLGEAQAQGAIGGAFTSLGGSIFSGAGGFKTIFTK